MDTNINTEAMADIFQEYDISASTDIIEKVTSDFIDHLNTMRDMEIAPFVKGNGESDFQKVLRLERELNKTKYELEKTSKEHKVYHDSVM